MKRFLLWLAAIAVVLTVVVVLAFRLSPWPSVALITYAFSRGDQAAQAALEKHVPPGIIAHRDLAYGERPDEVFDLYRAESAQGALPVIVWVHGGAWIAGTKDGVANYLKVLAGHGYAAIGVEYSTGLRSAYPKPVKQLNAALDHFQRNAAELGIDPDRIVLAGDSAGAQIAAQLSIIITDPSYAARIGIAPKLPRERLRGAVLVSGAYDIETIDLDGDFGWFLKTVLWAYSGARDFLADERFLLASVLQHVTPQFPPAFITSGNGDPLAPQAVRLAHKLEGFGVEVRTLFFAQDHQPPLPHEYQFNLDNAEGQEALRQTLAFMESALAPD